MAEMPPVQKLTTFITCSNCEKKLRPLFKICKDGHLICQNCNQHLNVDTGVAEVSTNCKDKEFPMVTMNALLRNLEDDCQYNCGFHSNIVDLSEHEKFCPLSVKCGINLCKWNKGLGELAEHVEKNHPEQVVDLLSVENYFTVDIASPIMLLTQFIDKDNPNYDMYWLRLLKYKENFYIMIQYQGVNSENEAVIKEYTVSPVDHTKIFIYTEVILQKSKEEDIFLDEFIIHTGTDITRLKGDKFVVMVKNLHTPVTIPDSIRSDLLCIDCGELLTPPIMMCATGHSVCGKCGLELKTCSQCLTNITITRNFALESIIKKIRFGKM